MSKGWIAVVLTIFMALEACAHHGAKRVECDGASRPINLPDGSMPVSVEPATAPPHDEGRQP
jgi:hypothetical protein